MHEPEIFIKALSSLLCGYTGHNVSKCIKSIPRKYKFLPSIAEIKDELDIEGMEKHMAYKRLQAELTIECEREENKKYENIDYEARKKQADKLLSGIVFEKSMKNAEKPKDYFINVRAKEIEVSINAITAALEYINSELDLENKSMKPFIDLEIKLNEALEFLRA